MKAIFSNLNFTLGKCLGYRHQPPSPPDILHTETNLELNRGKTTWTMLEASYDINGPFKGPLIAESRCCKLANKIGGA
jgi:hypothetical protein